MLHGFSFVLYYIYYYHQVTFALKSISCNMAHRTIFNATFRCGKMLQAFEIDLKPSTL